MANSTINRFLIGGFLAVLLTISVSGGSVGKPRKEKVIGTVVARDRLAPLFYTSYGVGSFHEVMIVHVSEPKKMRPQYIKVSCSRWGNEPSLPDEIYDSPRRWRFKVTRSPDCDSTLKQMATAYDSKSGARYYDERLLPERMPGAEAEQIPLEETLPCYTLKPGDIKLMKN